MMPISHFLAGRKLVFVPVVLTVLAILVTALRAGAFITLNSRGPVIQNLALPPVIRVVPRGSKNQPTFRRVQVNDSFGAADLMSKARRLLGSGHTARAVRLFQKIADQYGNKVIRSSGGLYVTIQRRIWEMLLALPKDQRAVYDQIYGPEAQAQIKTQIQRHDLSSLLAAGQRYFPAAAAGHGLDVGASWLFERGDFGEAAQLWVSLLHHPGMTAQEPMLLFRAGLAAHLAGEQRLAAKLQRQLSNGYPQSMGMFGGRQISLAAALTEALKQPSWLKASTEASQKGWPTFNGDDERTLVPDTHSVPGAMLWTDGLGGNVQSQGMNVNPATINAIEAQIHQQKIQIFSLGNSAAWVGGKPQIMYAFPTAGAGTLYVNTVSQVTAFNAASGFVLWRYPRSVVNSPQHANSDMAILAASVDHVECALAGGKLYTVLPSPVPPGFNPYGWGAVPPVRLVCLDRRDGRLVWSDTARQLAPAGLAANFMPVSAPMVRGNGVYILASAALVNVAERLYLLRINRHTGALVWRRYLCSVAAQGYGPQARVNAIPAMGGGVVYIATGFGADMAVDSRLGRMVWLHLTAEAPLPQNQMYFNNAVNRTIPWQVNPPLVYQGLLVTCNAEAGANAHIYVYQRSTGRVARSMACRDLSGAQMTLGIIHGNVIVVGRRVEAVSLASGSIQWKSTPIAAAGILVARPVLTQSYVYLPLKQGLLRVAVGTGLGSRVIPWPGEGTKQPGLPGNLLVTRQEIVAVNDDSITAYARWKTALAYDQGRIKRHPNNPLTYLTLSAIAFRTGHDALARQMMRQATMKANESARPSAAILERIFRLTMRFGDSLRESPKVASHQSAQFYYQMASLTARSARQQVAWRMARAESYLGLADGTKALNLLQQILARRNYREAPLRRADGVMLAGIAAETEISTALIGHFGVAIYQPVELQAQTMLSASPADPAELARVMKRYPNSVAAVTAAWRLADQDRTAAHWGRENRVLIWLKNHVRSSTQKPRVLALMIRNNEHRSHWNRARALARRGGQRYEQFQWQHAGKQLTFAQLAVQIERTAPVDALYHLPRLAYQVGEQLSVRPPIPGMLLMPLDRARTLQRPDLFLVAKTAGPNTELTCFGATNVTMRWKENIPAPHVTLVGFVRGNAILATPTQVLSVQVAGGKVNWRMSLQDLLAVGAVGVRPQRQAGRVFVNGVMVHGRGRVFVNGVLVNGGMGIAIGQPFVRGPMAVEQVLAATGVANLKIIGGELIVVGQKSLTAMNLQTGKTVWGTPSNLSQYGHIYGVLGSGDRLVALMDYPVRTLVVVDEASGAVQGAIRLPPGQPALWAGVGAGGTLYVVGMRDAMAYNLDGGLAAPLWNRSGLTIPFPQASALSQDGLIITQGAGLACLRLRDGTSRWRVEGIGSAGTALVPTMVKTFLNRDTVVVTSSQSVTALGTRSGQIRWRAVFVHAHTPPLSDVIMANPDLAILAQGPLGSAQHAVKLCLVDQADQHGQLDNGTVELNQRLIRSVGSPEGPLINNWAVVNDGIVFEINGNVCVYHVGP